MSDKHRRMRADAREEQRNSVAMRNRPYRTEITRLFNEGKTDEEIAQVITAAGRTVTANAVRKTRGRMGLIRRKGGYNGPKMDTAYIEREFAERNPQTREQIRNVIDGIATDVQRHPDHVRKYLRDQGIVARQHPEPDPEALKRAKELLDGGAPYPEVIRETNLTRDVLVKRFPGHSMDQTDASIYRAARRLEEKVGL